jgi:transcriptional regulator with XRE-family HTH domain
MQSPDGGPLPSQVADAYELVGAATALKRKSYAKSLGISPGTLDNYVNGHTEPKVTTPEQVRLLRADVQMRIRHISCAIELLGGNGPPPAAASGEIMQPPLVLDLSPEQASKAYEIIGMTTDLPRKRYAGELGISLGSVNNYLAGRSIPKAHTPAHVAFLLADFDKRMRKLIHALDLLSVNSR